MHFRCSCVKPQKWSSRTIFFLFRNWVNIYFSFTSVCTLSHVVVPRNENRGSTHCTLDHPERLHGLQRGPEISVWNSIAQTEQTNSNKDMLWAFTVTLQDFFFPQLDFFSMGSYSCPLTAILRSRERQGRSTLHRDAVIVTQDALQGCSSWR